MLKAKNVFVTQGGKAQNISYTQPMKTNTNNYTKIPITTLHEHIYTHLHKHTHTHTHTNTPALPAAWCLLPTACLYCCSLSFYISSVICRLWTGTHNFDIGTHRLICVKDGACLEHSTHTLTIVWKRRYVHSGVNWRIFLYLVYKQTLRLTPTYTNKTNIQQRQTTMKEERISC